MSLFAEPVRPTEATSAQGQSLRADSPELRTETIAVQAWKHLPSTLERSAFQEMKNLFRTTHEIRGSSLSNPWDADGGLNSYKGDRGLISMDRVVTDLNLDVKREGSWGSPDQNHVQAIINGQIHEYQGGEMGGTVCGDLFLWVKTNRPDLRVHEQLQEALRLATFLTQMSSHSVWDSHLLDEDRINFQQVHPSDPAAQHPDGITRRNGIVHRILILQDQHIPVLKFQREFRVITRDQPRREVASVIIRSESELGTECDSLIENRWSIQITEARGARKIGGVGEFLDRMRLMR